MKSPNISFLNFEENFEDDVLYYFKQNPSVEPHKKSF